MRKFLILPNERILGPNQVRKDRTSHDVSGYVAVCLVASIVLTGCFESPETPTAPAPADQVEVAAPLKTNETLSPKACAVKIAETLESRRQIVDALPNPSCVDGVTDAQRKRVATIRKLTASELEFPCMDAALRETYGVAEGSNVVFDDHALSPEMAGTSFGGVYGAICGKPYIAIARDTKRSLEKVTREPGFDSDSYIRNTLELVEPLRGDLPQNFDVVQLVNGDYSQYITKGETELATWNDTSVWTFCRLPSGTLFSAQIDNEVYDGPGGLQLLRDSLALADDWEGDDACWPDWMGADEEISDSPK